MLKYYGSSAINIAIKGYKFYFRAPVVRFLINFSDSPLVGYFNCKHKKLLF